MPFDLTLTSPTYAASGFSGAALSGGNGLTASCPIPANGIFTVELRVKTTSTSGVTVAVGSVDTFWVGISGGVPAARYGKSGSGEASLGGGGSIANNAYHHMALVLDGANGGKLFVDGVLLSTTVTPFASSGATRANPLSVRRLSTNFNWVGEIDELAIYDFAKYTADFTPGQPSDSDAGLISLYHFENNGLDTAGASADSTPPTWTVAPAVDNVLSTAFTITATRNEPGTTFYAVLPAGSAAPSSAQVKAGTNAAGTALAANLKGSFTGTSATVSGLTTTTAYDLYVVAQDNALNLQAAPVLVPVTTTALETLVFTGGKFSQGLSGGYIRTTNRPTNLTAFAVSAWATSTDSGTIRVVTGQKNGWWMGHDANGRAIAKYGGGAGVEQTLLSTITVNDGAYHHYAINVDANGGKFYVDGVLAASSADTFASRAGGLNEQLTIRDFFNGQYTWAGVVDEVAVYNTAKFPAAFTPPTAATPDTDAGLLGVFHLDNSAAFTLAAAAPAVPTGLTATGSVGQVALSWAASSGATSYPLLRSTNSSTGFTALASPTSNSYIDTTAVTGTPYYYRVQATNAIGTSAASATAGPATATAATPVGSGANNPAIIYSGSWLVSGTTAKTINTGQTFRTLVPAGAFTLNFDLTGLLTPLPMVAVFVNGVQVARQEVAASITITPNVSISTEIFNLVEVVTESMTETQNRWEVQTTAVVFTGLTQNGAEPALRQPVRKVGKVLIFGTSITEGVRTLASGASSGKDTDRNSATQCWPFALRELLGMEVDAVGFGGQGVSNKGSGDVPAVPNSYNQLWMGQARSFASPPDLIIIEHGTNDFTTNIQTQYRTLLNGLLAATPATTKILALQPLKGTQGDNIQAAIASCTDPSRVSYQSTVGWWSSTDAPDGLHPYGYASTALVAPKVAEAAKLLLAGAPVVTIPTGALPVGKSVFKFVGPAADNIANYPGLSIVWSVNEAGNWESGTPTGPSFQAVKQFVNGRKYYVLNNAAASISLYGAQL